MSFSWVREENLKQQHIQWLHLQQHAIPFPKSLVLWYLFVYFGPAFDLGYDHSHDASPEGGSEGEELLVGGDVLIPWVWVPAVKWQKGEHSWMAERRNLLISPSKLAAKSPHAHAQLLLWEATNTFTAHSIKWFKLWQPALANWARMILTRWGTNRHRAAWRYLCHCGRGSGAGLHWELWEAPRHSFTPAGTSGEKRLGEAWWVRVWP